MNCYILSSKTIACCVTSCFNPTVYTRTTVIEGGSILKVWPLETHISSYYGIIYTNLLMLHLHMYPQVSYIAIEAQSLSSTDIYYQAKSIWQFFRSREITGIILKVNTMAKYIALKTMLQQNMANCSSISSHSDEKIEDIHFIKKYSLKINF